VSWGGPNGLARRNVADERRTQRLTSLNAVRLEIRVCIPTAMSLDMGRSGCYEPPVSRALRCRFKNPKSGIWGSKRQVTHDDECTYRFE
jgi:hypothetical protein